MRHLVLYANKNTKGKHDGDEFANEAHAYSTYHLNECGASVVPVAVPCNAPAIHRASQVDTLIKQAYERTREPFDVFAYFGHGTERWLQTSHTVLNLENFVEVLSKVLSPTPILWWAACRTAANNPKPARKTEISRGGILQQTILRLLSKNIMATGWGHTTAGHTTRNPNLALVTPFEKTEVTPEQRKILQKKLWAMQSDARFQFPLATTIDGLFERMNRGAK